MKPPAPQFADRELDVMLVLWNRGAGTVAEIRAQLPDRLAYTTVLTVLQTLEQKGYVRHEKAEGRSYRYHPLVDRAEAGKSALQKLRDRLFEGSSALLLAELVSDRRVDEREIRRLRELLDARLRERRR